MATLEVHGQRGRDAIVTLTAPEYIVGSLDTCTIPIRDDDAVSRRHLRIEAHGDGDARSWSVIDLQSRNGTRKNDEVLVAEEVLTHGDELHFGRHTMLVFLDSAPARGNSTDLIDEAPTITRAEKEVLVELCRPWFEQGSYAAVATRKEIAARRFVGEGAVQNLLTSLYDKFGIPLDQRGGKARHELARLAKLTGAVSAKDYKKSTQ